ncbi:hypothetical protein [Ekhidna sp.]|uniref:hypothetical protein n=1 Tax=Ekhidna sp. TaxID=2608089 RepID=UPI00329A2EDC
MKKNILIIILFLTTSISTFYSYIKANEAEKLALEIDKYKTIADQQKMEAERQAELAVMTAAEAKRQEALALQLEDRLTKCQSK